MDKSQRISIIPAYNEAGTIGKVVAEIIQHSDVVVVDDCSSDFTASIAREAGAIVVTLPINSGYEGALNAGFKFASERSYSYALTIDADGQHDVTLVNSFFQLLESHKHDLVCGERPNAARISEWMMSLYFRAFYGVNDPLCGMKAYNLKYFKSIGIFDSKLLVGTELLVRYYRLGAVIGNRKIPIFPRKDQSRFGSSWRANVKIFKALVRVIKLK